MFYPGRFVWSEEWLNRFLFSFLFWCLVFCFCVIFASNVRTCFRRCHSARARAARDTIWSPFRLHVDVRASCVLHMPGIYHGLVISQSRRPETDTLDSEVWIYIQMWPRLHFWCFFNVIVILFNIFNLDFMLADVRFHIQRNPTKTRYINTSL